MIYVEILKDGKVFRGNLKIKSKDSIVLQDIINKNIYTVPLNGEYILSEYSNSKREKKIIQIIKIIDQDFDLNDKDKKFILNSLEPVLQYQIIKTLRYLEFNFNTLDDLKINDLKDSIKKIIQKEYIANRDYVLTDTDLNLKEKENLISTITRTKDNYLTLLETLSAPVDVFKEFPPMFNNNLIYIGEIINYIKNQKYLKECI